MRARPVSTTYRMPGTVSEVSATLVASTTRRREAGWLLNTRCCSAAREPGVERDDLGARQVGERVGGVADLPLAGQEHEHVARTLPGELGDGRADRLGLVALDRLAVLVVLRQLEQRAVPHLDRVGPAGHLDHGRVEVLGEPVRRRSSPT